MGRSREPIIDADDFFDTAHLLMMSCVNSSVKSQHDQVNNSARGLLAHGNDMRGMSLRLIQVQYANVPAMEDLIVNRQESNVKRFLTDGYCSDLYQQIGAKPVAVRQFTNYLHKHTEAFTYQRIY